MKGTEWKKIRLILNFALQNKESSFYRDKYNNLELSSFKTPEDFYKLPLLSKEELLKVSPFERCFLPLREIRWALNTSGTSGQEPLIIFRKEDSFSFLKYLPGLEKKLSFALILCLPRNLVAMYRSFAGKIPVLFGNPYQLQETALLASRLGIDVLYISPELLLHFLVFLKPRYDTKKIKLIRFYGSRLSEAELRIFHHEFPRALFAQGYALNEVSRVGFQCRELAKKEKPIFHIHSDQMFLEIIKEKSNEENGEIVLTHLRPEPSLLIRYRTGDSGQILKESCRCGIKHPLIRLLGRKELDKIKVSGFEIHRENFSEVIKILENQLTDEFEAHFYQRKHHGSLINEIELKLNPLPGTKITPEFKSLVETTFNKYFRISNRFSFHELIKQVIFLPIRVEFKKLEDGKLFHKENIPKKLIPHF